MNSSPGFPPPFSPCKPRERAQACQKSLADVYRTGLAISHGALWYLIYIRPDMGELKGLFWDIPHRWIWFLQLEQFPKYVPPSRFWSVLAVNNQSLALHTFTVADMSSFSLGNTFVRSLVNVQQCIWTNLPLKKGESIANFRSQIKMLSLFSVEVLVLIPRAGENAHARQHVNIWCNKIQYQAFGSCFLNVWGLKQK